MAETIEVQLPGTGCVIKDTGAQLVFRQEFEGACDRLIAEFDPDAYTLAEIRAELARREGTDAA